MAIKQLKQKNSVVAVIGLGGIGLSAVAMLTKFKLKQIIAIDIAKDKLKFAKELGADKIINLSKNLSKRIIENLKNDGVDYCVEPPGLVQTIELGFSIIKPRR